jgi:hypothetical protein
MQLSVSRRYLSLVIEAKKITQFVELCV